MDILNVMESKMATFSKGQRRIAKYISSQYDKAAFMTAAKLGLEVGVSESTVVRFVMELGFEGYPEFQRALQELIRTKLTSFQRVEVTNTFIGDGDLLSKVLYSDIDNIKKTIDGIDRDAFDRAVKKICTSKNVYIIGMRSASYLAGFLNHGLRMVLDNVKLIQTTSGVEMFEQLLGVSEGDVVIAISFPRYSKAVIKAVEMAKNSNVDVIAITDSENAPIARYASEALISRSNMAYFMDSLVAAMSVINALLVGVSRENNDMMMERLQVLEKIWEDYGVYDKNGN